MTTATRTTTLEVYLHDGTDWRYDRTAYAATVSLGFDQRYAEATIRRTGGGEIEVQYWSPVEIRMGGTPGEGAAPRFAGYVVPVDNALYPIENVLTCKGRLYRAAWVRNQQIGGTRMADPATGASDEQQVREILDACGVPHDPGNVGGTGKPLGLRAVDPERPLEPNPWVWQEGQSGLDYIEQLDAVAVVDVAGEPGGGEPVTVGRLRTYERLGGEVMRHALATDPGPTAHFSFTEGVDVLEARITRDPVGAANRVTVTGAPDPGNVVVPPGAPEDLEVAFDAVCRYTVTSGFAPYLPPGLPAGPDGYPVVATTFASPLIEKSARDDPDHPEDVLSCQQVAEFLLAEANCVLDTLEFSTPRDDLLTPGVAVHLHSPRLGLTDPTRHYWLQHLDVEVDERGTFTQRLRLLRKS